MMAILCIKSSIPMLENIIRALVLITNIIFIFTGLARADIPTLTLDPQVGTYDVTDYAQYYVDTSRSLPVEQIITLADTGRFMPTNGSMDFGDRPAAYWVHVRVKNSEDTTADWVLNTGSQRMQYAAVYFVKDGQITSLQLDSLDQPFTKRPTPHRLLVAGLTLAPQEQVDLYFTYRSAKSSYFPLKIMTPEAFSRWDAHQNRMIFLVLGAILVLALYSVFLFFTVDNFSYVYYLVFIAATFLYLLHQFGFTYQYLWPGMPYFNSYAAAVFGYTAGISGLMFGRSFFEVWKISRYLDMVYLGLAGIFAVASLYLYLWPDGVTIGVFGFMFGSVSATLNLIVAIIRFRRHDPSAGIAALGWGALVVWGIVINVTSFGIFRIPQQLIFDNFYMIYAVCSLGETTFLTLSLFVRTRQIIRANHRERQNYIRMLEEEAKTARALSIALQERQAAIEDAARKGRLVESLAHDIRQPLHAMRLSNYGHNPAPNNITDEAIDMIEGVLTTAFAVAETDETDTEVHITEVPARNILLPLSLVFAPPARDKHLAFKVMPSSLVVKTDRRILMRILNNLVTNAMRYTEKGRVLVGCRRRPAGVGFQVLDTGMGMLQDELETATRPGVRHSTTGKGHGLGLAICQRLCDRIGAELRISSIKGRGTVVEVYIPD